MSIVDESRVHTSVWSLWKVLEAWANGFYCRWINMQNDMSIDLFQYAIDMQLIPLLPLYLPHHVECGGFYNILINSN